MGAERLQVHRAYLSEHLTPYDQQYQELLSRHTHALQAMGHTASGAHDAAMNLINQTLTRQAAILSFADLYAYTAIAAFAIIPLTLLFRSGVAGRTR
jgi:MFS transporter, DHA2 family, multidrug resistance protein